MRPFYLGLHATGRRYFLPYTLMLRELQRTLMGLLQVTKKVHRGKRGSTISSQKSLFLYKGSAHGSNNPSDGRVQGFCYDL